MLITDNIPPANGTKNERIGLVLARLNNFLTNKESQHIQSMEDLKAAITDTQLAVDEVIQTLVQMVKEHDDLKGAVHGETSENIGLGKLFNWRSSIQSDAVYPYNDQVYLTSDIAKIMADELVKVDLDGFMKQGQLPLAYFEGGYYGSLMREFRTRIGYLKSVLGFINTSNTAVQLIKIQGDDDLSSPSFPMQNKKKISFLSNQDEYLITAPSDRYGIKDYPMDKYFLSTPIQKGLNPIIQEITDQPYIIRNVGWGGGNHLVSLNTDSSVYTLFSEDFYLGQNHPIELIIKSGESTHLNYCTIPGSGVLGTVKMAGSLQLDHNGVNLFLAPAVYKYVSVESVQITVDDKKITNASFISPLDPTNIKPINNSVLGNMLGLNGLNSYLGVVDKDQRAHTLLVGKAGKGINIPWDNMINFGPNDDRKIQLVDNSDIDVFYNYGSFDWEFEGKTLVGFIDGIITFLNHGNPVTAVFRCGLRITTGESINVELLEGVEPSSFIDGKISGGNTLFTNDPTDIFHPVYGRGLFLSFGGHVTGMTRATDIALVIREHIFTDLLTYAKGYWKNPDLGRTAQLAYTADRVSVLNAAARRNIPIYGDGSLTYFLTTAPSPEGSIENTIMVWDGEPPIHPTKDALGKSFLRSPTRTLSKFDYTTIPKALCCVLSNQLGVSINGLVFNNKLDLKGVEFYRVSDKLEGGKTWGITDTLRGVLTGLMSNVVNAARAKYIAAGLVIPAGAINGQWTLVINPTGTVADAISEGYAVFSDGCGYVGYVKIPLTVNTVSLVFSTSELASNLYPKMKFGEATPNFDIDSSDSGFEFYDVALTRLTGMTYLQCSRVFGSKRGGCTIDVNTGTFINVETPQVESELYPVSTDYSISNLPLPGGGAFYMSDPSDGVMYNGDKSIKLDIYADENPAVVVDTDGVEKYRYMVPVGTSFILNGTQFTLDQSLDCLYDAKVWPYLYIRLTHSGVELIGSTTLRQPTITEILYGKGSYGRVSMLTEPYCVVMDRLFSDTPKGSAVPMTLGLPMDVGTSNWKLK